MLVAAGANIDSVKSNLLVRKVERMYVQVCGCAGVRVCRCTVHCTGVHDEKSLYRPKGTPCISGGFVCVKIMHCCDILDHFNKSSAKKLHKIY